MRICFLALFILSSLIHLYGSFQNDQRIRNISKGLILLCLTGYYIFSSERVYWLVIAALLLSWLGDVFLIFKGGFAVGGISFMASHICFICLYLPQVSLASVPWFVFVAVVLVYGTAVFLVFRALKEFLPEKLYYPMMLYLIVNGLMNGTALLQLVSMPCLATALIFLGAMMFFTSDSILFIVRFHKTHMVWRRHFLVMLTYILAEYLIVQGLLLLGL